MKASFDISRSVGIEWDADDPQFLEADFRAPLFERRPTSDQVRAFWNAVAERTVSLGPLPIHGADPTPLRRSVESPLGRSPSGPFAKGVRGSARRTHRSPGAGGSGEARRRRHTAKSTIATNAATTRMIHHHHPEVEGPEPPPDGTARYIAVRVPFPSTQTVVLGSLRFVIVSVGGADQPVKLSPVQTRGDRGVRRMERGARGAPRREQP